VTDRRLQKYHLYSVIAIVFFSTIEVVGKIIAYDISPYAVTAWRFLLGGLLLLPFAWKDIVRQRQAFNGRAIFSIAVYAVLNICISMLMLQLSIYYGRANLSAIIVSSNPMFVVLIAGMFHSEKLSPDQIISIVVGCLGLLLLILGTGNELLHSRNLVLGIAFGMGAAITFALATVYSKRLIISYGNLPTASLAFIIGGVLLGVISLVSGKQVLFPATPANVTFILYLSIGVTGIAYLLFFAAIKGIGAVTTSSYFFLKPLIALCLAWLIHRERVSLIQIFGILLIIQSLNKQLLGFILSKLTFLKTVPKSN